MKNVSTLNTHVFSDGATPHTIHQDGRTIYHHRCINCGRDFAQGLNGAGWQAVHISLFRIELLADGVTDQWIGEECPKQILWDRDKKARTMLKVGEPASPASDSRGGE